MGTRSLTFVHDGPEDPTSTKAPLLCIYTQYDGYFDGLGLGLVGFLAGGRMVNGIGMGDDRIQFNGAGDLAARLVTHYKGGDPNYAGGVYVVDPTLNDDDMGAEYTYHVYCVLGEEPYVRAKAIYTDYTVEGPASQIDLSYPED